MTFFCIIPNRHDLGDVIEMNDKRYGSNELNYRWGPFVSSSPKLSRLHIICTWLPHWLQHYSYTKMHGSTFSILILSMYSFIILSLLPSVNYFSLLFVNVFNRYHYANKFLIHSLSFINILYRQISHF